MKDLKDRIDGFLEKLINKPWKKGLVSILGFIFIPWLWWLYLILLGYWAIKNWKDNRKMVIKRLTIGGAIFVVLVTVVVLIDNAYGAVTVSGIPNLTRKKTLKLEGKSSYKDGKIQITGAAYDKAVEIDGNGKFSIEIELKENENVLSLEPTSKDGKKGWKKELKITLDTTPPSLDLDTSSVTESEKIEIKGKTESGATVILFKGNDEIMKLEKVKGGFSFNQITLQKGDNKFKIISSDNAGNEKIKEFSITYDTAKAEAAAKAKAEADAAAKAKADADAAAAKAKADAEAGEKAEATKELDAEVRFSSTAFMIKNKESKNWTNCKFVLNGKLFGSDYTYNSSMGIIAQDSVIIPMNEFPKSDGTRFNPFSMKAKNLFISCDVVSNHRTGYYIISE